MRPSFALLALLLPGLALAQPRGPTPGSNRPPDADERRAVSAQARGFFSDLLQSNARGLVRRSAVPFQLEGRRIESAEALLGEWVRRLRSKRADLLTLYDIEVLTPGEMEKKHGRPPARLAALSWQSPRTYVAVANLSGHAAIAVLRSSGQGYQVVGYTD